MDKQLNPSPPKRQRPSPPETLAGDTETAPEQAGAWALLTSAQRITRPDKATVLYLQRTIGNQAVRRMLKPPASPTGARPHRPSPDQKVSDLAAEMFAPDALILQRFVSSEHRSLGDLNASETPVDFPEGTLFPNSPALSYGEIVALSGDFYGSFENLRNPNYINAEGRVVANSTERKIREINQLKRLFQVEAEIRAAGREPEGLDMGNVEHNGESLEGFDKTTGGRYLALAEQNFPHFTDADPNNIGTWMSGHAQALTEAYEAGLVNDTGKKLLALARNAASNHFLTDAFASGHMRIPRSDIDQYYRNMMAAVAPALADELVDLLPADFDLVLDLRPYVPDFVEDIPGVSRYLRYRVSIELRSQVEAAIAPYVADFTAFMRDDVGPKLGGLVSKWLHDADNENGLLVTNKAGGRWMAYGDAFLDRAPPTGISVNTANRAEAQKAVTADRAEVEAMFELGRANASGESDSDDDAGPIPDAVYFDFDKPRVENDTSVLNAATQGQLNSLARYLNSVNGVTVNLEGWADSRGSVEYNRGLAIRRISAVQAYLVGVGVPAEKIAPSPQGEPLGATTSGNHHLFRRVDIAVVGTPTPAEDDSPTDAAPIPEPFAAEQFLPQVEEAENTPMESYEWCNLDAAQKASLRNGLKPIIKGGATDMLQAVVEDKLPNDYEIDFTIPIPLMDDIHIQETISIKEMAMDIATPLINKAVNGVMSDTVFGNLMDGACSLGE